ncbi:MAG: response regulator [Deltaproteobacteria bacterium]|nr:response regulator [Deltaproteobacteria bacterium]
MSRILVIDDDPIIRQMGKAYFTAKGHQVDTAVDGKDGIAKFKASTYDIVITDLMMPVMHGFEFIDLMKGSVQGQKTPVLLLTADRKEPGLDAYERRAWEDDHLAKPFDIPVLEEKVNGLIAEYKDRD